MQEPPFLPAPAFSNPLAQMV